jgi:hypothetical protein
MRSFVSRFDKRLVHQHERRLDHDRSRNRHALLLATRQLTRQLAFMADQLHELQALRARGAPLAFATPRIFSPKPTLSSTLMCGNSA